ncbi:hypothetical protein Cgig2_029594 [Carnegiea gigantea]|uniref:Endonuclease/exonuclease/phosphatase domain-containing protein n=1 Tax=Carnegiea gigantea TaxID=171969 RepID=A0A9Q1JHR2_9CARY|nr:hypothetical protein Cgig2_029594 [Carnegiea gigantea]
MLGHTIELCKKKTGTRKEWRPIQKTPTAAQEDISSTAFLAISTFKSIYACGQKIDQLKHCKVTQLSTNKSFYLSMICGTNKSFYLSMICGMNHELQREQLWLDLNDISHSMEDAWCLMGDFNTIRFKEDKIGGNEVQDHDLRNWPLSWRLASFMN